MSQQMEQKVAELEELGQQALALANDLASDAAAFDPCKLLGPLKIIKTVVCTLSIFVAPLKLPCEALKKIIEELEKHCEG